MDENKRMVVTLIGAQGGGSGGHPGMDGGVYVHEYSTISGPGCGGGGKLNAAPGPYGEIDALTAELTEATKLIAWLLPWAADHPGMFNAEGDLAWVQRAHDFLEKHE